MRKQNFTSLAVKAKQKCGSGTEDLSKSRQRRNAEVDLPILGSSCKTSAEDERDLSKSWPSRKYEKRNFRSLAVMTVELRKPRFRALKGLAELKCSS